MTTTTLRKKVIRAIRNELRLSVAQANDIMDSSANYWAFRDVAIPSELTAVVANAWSNAPRLNFYIQTNEGYVFVASLALTTNDIERWKALPMEDAYANANKVANQAPIRDDEGRVLESVNGEIFGCELKKGYIAIDAQINGEYRECVKIPSINDLSGTYAYVRETLGTSGTLMIGTIGENDLGIDPATTFIDMIIADNSMELAA